MRLAIQILLLALLAAAPAEAAQKKILFDNTRNETAGNGDWIIDTDQPVPVPAPSTVTAGTAENYWLGAISSWGIAMVKKGYDVATLTTTYGITYGNAGNAYDLSNFDVFVIPEPQHVFTAAESTAIFAFLRNGGGVVAVGDHNGSDRDSDGYDSPKIYNALDAGHLLGVHWGVTGDANNNISQVSTNVAPSSTDSITHGPAGTVVNFSFHNGNTYTLYPVVNPTVRGEVWMNGASQSGTTQAMVASAVYGNGRIVFIADSSPMDDGSGQAGNSLYTGWTETGTTDSTVFMNATLWVTRRTAVGDTTRPVVHVTAPVGGESWVQGTGHAVQWTSSDNVGVDSVSVDYSVHGAGGPWLPLIHGAAASGSYSWTVPMVVSDSMLVRATAYDHALNFGTDTSDSLFHVAAAVIGAGDSGRAALALSRPSPNPSGTAVRLRYSLPVAGAARLEVLDVTGRLVWTTDAHGKAGDHSAEWDGRTTGGQRASAGLYFVRLVTEAGTRTERLVRMN